MLSTGDVQYENTETNEKVFHHTFDIPPRLATDTKMKSNVARKVIK